MTCSQERFERDVAQHQMTIVRENGVDRHIKFRSPEGSSYWFEILTWPGALCIRGDCGTYVFSRLTDMFEFFRTDDRGDPSRLYINSGYWCEKLQASSCDGYGKGAAKRFDAEVFERTVKEHFDAGLADCDVTDERREQLWNAIQQEVLDYACDGDSSTAFGKLHDFHDDEFPRLFEDCWEWDCEEYTFRFIWNLYAIAWAIRKYDASKRESNVESATA
ncbi:hypothetical protein B7R77_02950 [Ralstonia solanacearum K60]|uniref:Uncharacterized protein n=2 Tax=Ralstonia solanacearum species complex TaxID=3116862 RepID=A0AAP7ZL27_RALSL|nr:hypothetical protein [Ralstonia solanacearum]OYQ12314.1 hypothetical protein B7R77_02950 [Ralstonia solanacearum K60]CCF96511.1 conserved hypothetical protein [Ralstonia solanacearum K60]